MSSAAQDFSPPSDALHFADGIWQPRHVSAVSFPEHAHDVCYRGGRAVNRGAVEKVSRAHKLPSLISGIVGALHRWELARLKSRQPIPFGTSLLAVARKI